MIMGWRKSTQNVKKFESRKDNWWYTKAKKNINYLKVIKLHIGGYGLEMFEMELGKDGKDR